MKILVFGGWGQLGTDLVMAGSARHELVRPRHVEVDITDAAAVNAATADCGPDVVVNLAAFHKVELCDDEPERALRVNALGALNVARAASRNRARAVYVSTDYVFDGSRRDGYSESDATSPLNVYGVSKAAGEAATMAVAPDAIVVRGSGLFGHAGSAGKGGNFVDNMIARARAGESLSVVDDQFFAPTATHDMAERILLMLERAVPPGIYHAANAGSCSWFELARTAIQLAGVDAQISPRATGESPVRRPAYSMLLDTRGPIVGLPASRSWQDALKWYLTTPRPVVAGAIAEPEAATS